MNTSNLDLLPGLPCVLPSTSPQHLHQVKEEVYAQLVHVYQLQSQPFLNSYVQHSSQVDPDAFLTTSKKNDFHSNHNNSLTFKKRKKLNHKALEESSSSLYFTTSRNDLGLNTQLKKNKSSPIQHHPQTTRSERGYNKSESESESESENENENGRQPILTTHQDYFRRIQVYFHYLKKLKRSVDASILPLPELPSNLHIPSCRENFTLESAKVIQSIFLKHPHLLHQLPPDYSTSFDASSFELHNQFKSLVSKYKKELDAKLKDPTLLASYSMFEKELHFVDQVDFFLDVIELVEFHDHVSFSQEESSSSPLDSTLSTTPSSSSLLNLENTSKKGVFQLLADKLCSRFPTKYVFPKEVPLKLSDLQSVSIHLLKFVLERKLKEALQLLKDTVRSGHAHPCFETIETLLQTHSQGEPLLSSMILACDSWSHRMDKDPLTPTELTLTLRVLVGHPIPYLTAWHDVLTLYSYRPSPSSSMMETENEGVELHPSVQLRTLVCGTQWKNEEEKQKQQPQKENHLDSFQPSSSSNGFESMMKHWLMYQTVIDDQWVDPWFLHLMLLWPTSTIRTTSTRSNLTSSPTTSSLSSSDRSIPPPTKLPHLQASIVDPSSSLQESMMRTRKRKRKENLYPSSSTPFSSSSFTPKKPLHVLRYYVFVTMLSFPKYRETYFIPAYASSTGISREVWTSMYLPSVLPTWSTYVSQDQLSRLFESAQAILCDSSLFPSPSPSTFTRNQLIQIYFQAYLSTFHVPWLIPCTPPSLVQATEPESPGSCFSVHPQIKKKRGPTVWQHIAHRWLMYLNSIRPTTTTTTTTPPWTTTHLLPSHQRWVQLIQLLGGGRGGHQGPPSATPPLTSKVGVLSKTYKRDMGRGVLHRVTQEEEEEVQEDDEEGYVFSSFQWKVFCVAWSLGWKYLKDPSIPWTHHDLFTLLTTLKFMEAQVEESENQGSLTKGIGGGGSSLSFHRMYEVLMARMLEIEE